MTEPDRSQEILSLANSDLGIVAAVTLADARPFWCTEEARWNLGRALETRGVIDQAKGALIAREGYSADEAFEASVCFPTGKPQGSRDGAGISASDSARKGRNPDMRGQSATRSPGRPFE